METSGSEVQDRSIREVRGASKVGVRRRNYNPRPPESLEALADCGKPDVLFVLKSRGFQPRLRHYSAQAGTWLDLLSLTKEKANVQANRTFSCHPGRSVANRNGHRVGGGDRLEGESFVPDDSWRQFRAGVRAGRARHADSAFNVDRKTDAARCGGRD